MASNITITLTSKWRYVESDGSECLGCGDKIFMEQKRLFLEIDGKPLTECDEINLCQSCAAACDLG